MNGRQAAREAAKRIEELEHANGLYAADVKAYNACIDSMIAGGSPCEYCEDQNECQLQAKADGKGCADWMLADKIILANNPEEVSAIDVEGILPPGEEGGDGAENASGETSTL